MPGGRCHVQCASVVVVLSCLVDDEVVHHGVDGTARCNGFCNEFLRVGGCIHVRLDVEALQNQLVISPCIIPDLGYTSWHVHRHGSTIDLLHSKRQLQTLHKACRF